MSAVEMADEGTTPHPTLYGPPQRQWDAMPRWLRWSGLAQVLGPTAWAIYTALVMTDHQTMHMPSRRHYDGGAFELRQEALERLTGLGNRSITRHVETLMIRGVLARYRPGRAAQASWYAVDRELLTALYRYAGPILPPEYQGIRGIALRDNLEGGVIIYGYHEQMPLTIAWESLWAWQREGLSQGLPEMPLTANVEKIVENHVARESR